MSGELRIVEGTIYDFLSLAMQTMERQGKTHWIHNVVHKGRVVTRRISQHNPVGKAKQNVPTITISRARSTISSSMSTGSIPAPTSRAERHAEEAQLAKKRHLAAKLDIKPGMKVLDIGSGWGGLGLYLAEICGAQVTGVTLSEEQHKLSNDRAVQRGVSDRVQFLLKDYRHLEEKFDRIVSVGMFEHVGIGHYPEFFSKVATLLKDDGAAVLHSINRSDGPGATSAWINRHIFPGGYIPALSEVIPHLEQQGLYVTDIEILRLHYAETLRHWAKRFADNRERAKALYDERFCRMWEFYLAGSECAFRFGGMNNFQIQFGLNQHVLPLTRDYIICGGREAAQDREQDSEAAPGQLVSSGPCGAAAGAAAEVPQGRGAAVATASPRSSRRNDARFSTLHSLLRPGR